MIRKPNWDPFKKFEQLQEDLTTLLDHVAEKEVPLRSGNRIIPTRQLKSLQNGISSLVQKTPLGRNDDQEEPSFEIFPVADVIENDAEFTIHMELPGFIRDQIKINLAADKLSISGERKFERDPKRFTYHRLERTHGTFYRAFILPEEADRESIKADLKEGVLIIHIAKKPESPAQNVEINVG